MTTLEIIWISTSLLSLAFTLRLHYLLREKNLLIDNLILIINSGVECKVETMPSLIKSLEKLKDKQKRQ
jgi:hypothetical protein